METIVTSADVLTYLEITVAVLLVVVLYHLLFITVDLRKVLRRIDSITNEVENIIMKPINAADYILEGLMKYLDTQSEQKIKKKKSTKKKK
jgi:cell shape-determining protein MreC